MTAFDPTEWRVRVRCDGDIREFRIVRARPDEQTESITLLEHGEIACSVHFPMTGPRSAMKAESLRKLPQLLGCSSVEVLDVRDPVEAVFGPNSG